MKKIMPLAASLSFLVVMSVAPVSASAQIEERNECYDTVRETCFSFWEEMGYSSNAACYADQVRPMCDDGGTRPPSVFPLPNVPVYRV
jgi:hypothetical protein